MKQPCGCSTRSTRLWQRVARYEPSERAFYLPSGIRVPWKFVSRNYTRAFLILFIHRFWKEQ